jgi:hypothetical protein
VCRITKVQKNSGNAMKTADVRKGSSTNAPVLAMANRFSRYKPEEEKAVRKVEVVENETLKKMKEAWNACSYTSYPYDRNPDREYAKMLEVVKKSEYSAKDIENFTLALAEFQEENRFSGKAGVFLSALINNCKDSELVIRTVHLAKSINFLGYKNTKKITVKGNAGADVGHNMQGGTITVEGNAGSHVGYDMEGGTITVNEDAGGWVGHWMNGGEIRIEGKIESISNSVEHGKIYHKGKLIVDK